MVRVRDISVSLRGVVRGADDVDDDGGHAEAGEERLATEAREQAVLGVRGAAEVADGGLGVDHAQHTADEHDEHLEAGRGTDPSPRCCRPRACP